MVILYIFDGLVGCVRLKLTVDDLLGCHFLKMHAPLDDKVAIFIAAIKWHISGTLQERDRIHLPETEGYAIITCNSRRRR